MTESEIGHIISGIVIGSIVSLMAKAFIDHENSRKDRLPHEALWDDLMKRAESDNYRIAKNAKAELMRLQGKWPSRWEEYRDKHRMIVTQDVVMTEGRRRASEVLVKLGELVGELRRTEGYLGRHPNPELRKALDDIYENINRIGSSRLSVSIEQLPDIF